MANNYSEMSVLWDFGSPEANQYFHDLWHQLGELDYDVDEKALENQRAEYPLAAGALLGDRHLFSAFELGGVYGHVELQGGKVAAWHEEGINLELAFVLAQHTLDKFGSDEVLSGTWAETCSKPRTGEFGGGWFAISREEILSGTTWSSAEQAVEKLKRRVA